MMLQAGAKLEKGFLDKKKPAPPAEVGLVTPRCKVVHRTLSGAPPHAEHPTEGASPAAAHARPPPAVAPGAEPAAGGRRSLS